MELEKQLERNQIIEGERGREMDGSIRNGEEVNGQIQFFDFILYLVLC